MEEIKSDDLPTSPDVKRVKLDTSVQTDLIEHVGFNTGTHGKLKYDQGSLDYQVIPVVSYDSSIDPTDNVSSEIRSILSTNGTISLIDILRKYKGALLLPNIYGESISKLLTLEPKHKATDNNALLLTNNNFLVEPQVPFEYPCECDHSTPETDTSKDPTPQPRRKSVPYPSAVVKKTKAQRDQERAQEEARKKVRFIKKDMEADTNFRITLSIKNEANGQTVYYKGDKKRFRREKTIKLMVNCFYRVDISFKPTQTLARALIGGQEVKATQRVHDSTASAYSLYLPTITMTPSRKGHRDELVLIIQLTNGLLLQLSLQVKLYKSGDSQHCDWGSTFHCVEYECEVFTDAGIVTVIKETFR